MKTTAYLLLALVAVQCVAAQRGLPLDDKENMENKENKEIEESKENEENKENKEEGNVRIINGEDADEGEYPFMVRIASIFGDHTCGGSLLSPNIVLTAAHCLVDSLGAKSPLQLLVTVVGDHTGSQVEDNEQEIEALRYIVHEDYYLDVTGVPMNDLALIVLKEEVTLTEGATSTIDLAEDNTHYSEGTTVTVIGWGNNADEPEYEGGPLPLPDTLQELEYVIAVGSECKAYWEKEYGFLMSYFGIINHELDIDGIFESSVCTIDPESEATIWNGDSGGPLFVKTGDKFTQIGVVSWGGLDPKVITYNMFASTYHYLDWIKEAMSRASTEESWLELHTGASHGVVTLLDKSGTMATVCNDDVGENEVLAICRDLGFKTGTLSNIIDYIPYGSKKKQEPEYSYYAPFGYTNLKCPTGANKVMSECKMDKYEESDVPCFNGQQLTVKCTNQIWSLNVFRFVVDVKDSRRTEFVRGRVGCKVHAQKYGWDMTSEVRVGLVVWRQGGLVDIVGDMKLRMKYDYMYTTKVKPSDEIKQGDCLACLAYVPGTGVYAVGESGGCLDNSEYYAKWVEDKNNEN